MTIGHLDELHKAEMVSKSKLVPSVFIKTYDWSNYRYWILLKRWSLQTVSLYCLIPGLGLSIGEVKGEYTRDESWVKKVIPNWSKNKEDQKYLQVKLQSL